MVFEVLGENLLGLIKRHQASRFSGLPEILILMMGYVLLGKGCSGAPREANSKANPTRSRLYAPSMWRDSHCANN
jgi:hypothetical protein